MGYRKYRIVDSISKAKQESIRKVEDLLDKIKTEKKLEPEKQLEAMK